MSSQTVHRSLNQTGTSSERERAQVPHPQPAIPVMNLTEQVRQGCITGGEFDDSLLQQLSRGLFRSSRHVMLVGERGVGKTTLLFELARQAAAGRLPHLADKQLLHVDCQQIPATDARPFLEALAQSARQESSTIWCLDGVGRLLKDSGPAGRAALSMLLHQSLAGVVLVINREEYPDLLSRDADLLMRLTLVELPEPEEDQAHQIAQGQARRLAEQFQVKIEPGLVQRAVGLTSNFLLSERHPAKTIRLLQQVCEDLEFNRSQLGMSVGAMRINDVIQTLSQWTGIPPETIAGDSSDEDFEAALTAAVVGQEHAVQEVARELQLIKAGWNEPGKPASVMLFAGMTGVGKTELAKRIAELYSSSRRLQTYTMANFTEPHSVSGIIGVPPGYVGYEEGGRLINELSADPYSVILLDEAEKAHPNVWKPFLNLFDEGWIVDQRGVKAYADRAIFILTTNAGDRNIAQMTKSGRCNEEITEHVKQTLSKVRHERSSQPVFPPAFLARIGRIVVFNPLDKTAMIGIAQRVCQKLQRTWQQKRQQQLTIPPELIEQIGQTGHELNERSGGREGGRIIRKLVADAMDRKIGSWAFSASAPPAEDLAGSNHQAPSPHPPDGLKTHLPGGR